MNSNACEEWKDAVQSDLDSSAWMTAWKLYMLLEARKVVKSKFCSK
jgi:hypothetical protein